MKKILPSIIMFAVLIYIIPITPVIIQSIFNSLNQSEAVINPQSDINLPQQSTSVLLQPENMQTTEPNTAQTEPLNSDILKIYNEATDIVEEITLRDYTIGAVAAEMPMSYSDEALKAQAVAALSYALSMKVQTNGGNPNLGGAYFSANPTLRMGYLTDEVMQSFWGDAYSQNKARLENIVDSLDYKILTYENLPAATCYHAINTGYTQSAGEVWGQDIPYLISVESPYDITNEEYLSEMSFSTEEMIFALRSMGVEPIGAPSEWFYNFQVNEQGYTTSVTVNEKVLDAQEFRNILGLRSTAFEISLSETNKFIITTRGYGHGVGLSQYGANSMALAGKTHEEILMHYYPKTNFSYAI